MLEKQKKQYRRHRRVRAKISGTSEVPRLSVFRSNKYIYAQVINDDKGETLVAASNGELSSKLKAPTFVPKGTSAGKQKSKEEKIKTGKVAVAYEVGRLIAKKALEKKIKKVVFDRGGYKYHGRVKAVADGAREEGLKF